MPSGLLFMEKAGSTLCNAIATMPPAAVCGTKPFDVEKPE